MRPALAGLAMLVGAALAQAQPLHPHSFTFERNAAALEREYRGSFASP